MISTGIFHQYKSVILLEPEILGIKETKAGSWRYLRVLSNIWPGQSSLIETDVKQRFIGFIKQHYSDYADWMVTVTYKAE